MPVNRWRQGIDKLIADHRSGSQEVINEALALLIDAVGDSVPGDAASYRNWLMRLGRELIGAKPATAHLFRLVNGMLWATEAAPTAGALREQALVYLQDYDAASATTLETVAEIAARTLAAYPALMTFSRSTTVLRALTLMAEQGRGRPIYCSEGRPNYEGQTLASELVWAGLRVTLGVDMALFGWLPQVRALVLGADSISTHGMVAKLGIAPLTRAARELEIPVYVLCTADKFMPAEYYSGRSLGSGPREEIMPESSDRLAVSNVYYDVTPMDQISSVITENGRLQADELMAALKQVRVFPGLRGR
jgi:translation initiation factor 2B subunit (eIF-2B alpha/beta/delta family)